MKHLYFSLLALAVYACASAPKSEEQAIATTATGTVTVVSTTTETATVSTTDNAAAMSTSTAVARPLRDVIAGQVLGEEPMMEVSKHANVRLLHGGTELANLTADAQGDFRFEGTFPKGRYEISVRDGKLRGAREISFAGGEMTGVSVLVTDGKGDHRRRRRKH